MSLSSLYFKFVMNQDVCLYFPQRWMIDRAKQMDSVCVYTRSMESLGQSVVPLGRETVHKWTAAPWAGHSGSGLTHIAHFWTPRGAATHWPDHHVGPKLAPRSHKITISLQGHSYTYNLFAANTQLSIQPTPPKKTIMNEAQTPKKFGEHYIDLWILHKCLVLFYWFYISFFPLFFLHSISFPFSFY